MTWHHTPPLYPSPAREAAGFLMDRARSHRTPWNEHGKDSLVFQTCLALSAHEQPLAQAALGTHSSEGLSAKALFTQGAASAH